MTPRDAPDRREASAAGGRPLSGADRKRLRGRAHALRPVVHVGADGVTDAVVAAVDRALAVHELVKVRLVAPEDKRASAHELARRTGSEACGLVGHTVILYRPRPGGPPGAGEP